MGMFLDYSRPSRTDWKFTYKGSELVSAAKKKLAEITGQFLGAQTALKEAVSSTNRVDNDHEVDRARKDVERLGPRMEECQVFLHEFRRMPDREFHLSLSDVTFFDLHV